MFYIYVWACVYEGVVWEGDGQRQRQHTICGSRRSETYVYMCVYEWCLYVKGLREAV